MTPPLDQWRDGGKVGEHGPPACGWATAAPALTSTPRRATKGVWSARPAPLDQPVAKQAVRAGLVDEVDDDLSREEFKF